MVAWLPRAGSTDMLTEASSIPFQRRLRGAPAKRGSGRPKQRTRTSIAAPGGMSSGKGWSVPKCSGSAWPIRRESEQRPTWAERRVRVKVRRGDRGWGVLASVSISALFDESRLDLAQKLSAMPEVAPLPSLAASAGVALVGFGTGCGRRCSQSWSYGPRSVDACWTWQGFGEGGRYPRAAPQG